MKDKQILKAAAVAVYLYLLIFIMNSIITYFSDKTVFAINSITPLIPINSSKGLQLLSVILYLITFFLTPLIDSGTMGSFFCILTGDKFNLRIFVDNIKKYYLRNLGFSISYNLTFMLIIMAPLLAIDFVMVKSSSLQNLTASYIYYFTTGFLIIPNIVLSTFKLSRKGYYKNNFIYLLFYSGFECVISLIPIVGAYIVLIMNIIYPYLIFKLYPIQKVN